MKEKSKFMLIIKTVILLNLLAFGNAAANGGEKAAIAAGCPLTWTMQNKPYLLDGSYGEHLIRGAAIENCSCKNGCRKRNQVAADECRNNGQSIGKKGNIFVSSAEARAADEGCRMTWVMQNQRYLIGGYGFDNILRAAAIENCICFSDKCCNLDK